MIFTGMIPRDSWIGKILDISDKDAKPHAQSLDPLSVCLILMMRIDAEWNISDSNVLEHYLVKNFMKFCNLHHHHHHHHHWATLGARVLSMTCHHTSLTPIAARRSSLSIPESFAVTSGKLARRFRFSISQSTFIALQLHTMCLFYPKHLGLCLQLNKLKRSLISALFVVSLAISNVHVILSTDQGLGKMALPRLGKRSTERLKIKSLKSTSLQS